MSHHVLKRNGLNIHYQFPAVGHVVIKSHSTDLPLQHPHSLVLILFLDVLLLWMNCTIINQMLCHTLQMKLWVIYHED